MHDRKHRFPGGAKQSRSSAALDLALASGIVIVSIPFASASVLLARSSGLAAAIKLAAFQFGSEGLVPLLLVTLRHERLADYGFSRLNLAYSLVLGGAATLINDLLLSAYTGAWLWIPLRRHTAVRLSLAAGLPWSVVGLAATVVAWGFFEAFFGVYFARKVNELLGHRARGWLAPGALAFALFNGLLHAAIGQGSLGFISSAVSGYVMAVIPGATGNAWGSVLFQTATNAVGKL